MIHAVCSEGQADQDSGYWIQAIRIRGVKETLSDDDRFSRAIGVVNHSSVDALVKQMPVTFNQSIERSDERQGVSAWLVVHMPIGGSMERLPTTRKPL